MNSLHCFSIKFPDETRPNLSPGETLMSSEAQEFEEISSPFDNKSFPNVRG